VLKIKKGYNTNIVYNWDVHRTSKMYIFMEIVNKKSVFRLMKTT